MQSSAMRLLAVAVGALTAASCGSDLLRTGRAPVFLQLNTLSAEGGTLPVLSDVAIQGSAVNDVGEATIAVVAKDQTANAPPTTPINTVTLTRYHVEYRRTDGRNTPGVDVPFPIDGGVSVSIEAGGSQTVLFDIVRHAAKLEPPLRSLANGGGRLIISTIAHVTFYGRDQNGNEVMVTGLVDVTFGDFPDP